MRLPKKSGSAKGGAFIVPPFFFFGLLLAVSLIGSGCQGASSPSQVDAQTAAAQIKNLYESRRAELKPQMRAHLFLRLYRTSGNPEYLPELKDYAAQLRTYLDVHNSKLSEPGYIEKTAKVFLDSEGLSPKHQMRRRALEKHPDFPFYHRVVYLFFQLRSLGMDPSEPVLKPAMDALRIYNFRQVLMDPDIMTYHAAEAANTVYYLKSLGIVDLEEDFLESYRRIFMEIPDKSLGMVEYENKLYGLTHIIIAASGYYQTIVSAEKFQWILKYFAENIDEILARSKWDVIAEVGLCFKLAGFRDHPAISKTQGEILRGFDVKKGMVPGKTDPPDLNKLEHRNILSYMLFKNFEHLYPGPEVAGITEAA